MPKRYLCDVTAEDDEGRVYRLTVYQHYAVTETLKEGRQEVDTIKEFKCGSDHVNPLDPKSEDPTEFELLRPEGNIRLTRLD